MNLPRAGQSQPKGRIRPAGRKMPRSVLCYAFVSSMPTSLVGLNKTFLKKNLTLNSKKNGSF